MCLMTQTKMMPKFYCLNLIYIRRMLLCTGRVLNQRRHIESMISSRLLVFGRINFFIYVYFRYYFMEFSLPEIASTQRTRGIL